MIKVLEMTILRKKDMVKMGDKELEAQLNELNLELSKEKANVHIGANVTSPGRLREMRKTIARIKTLKRNKGKNESK